MNTNKKLVTSIFCKNIVKQFVVVGLNITLNKYPKCIH